MKGFRVWGLGIRLIIIFVFLYPIPYTLYPVYAAESTPSADPDSIGTDIKSKLEELKKEIASRAAKLKQEVDKKLQNKAYVGKVKSRSENSITLAAETGPKIVSTNQDTIYENRQSLPTGKIKNKQKFSQKTLIEEDYIAALGDVDETGVLIAKKVILLPTTNSEQHTPPSEVKTYLWGQVVSISDEQSSSTSKLATLKDKSGKNIAFSLPETKIKLNDYVILTGRVDKEIFDVEFVYVIPQGKIIKPKSATSSATKSAIVKPASR